MLRKFISILVLSVAVLCTSLAFSQAETKVGTNIDSRVIIGLKADSGAVQDFLPDGWKAISFPSGALAGSNVLVSFIDGVLMIDPDGKPLNPSSRRAVALLGLAKQDGGDGIRIFVLRTYSTEPAEIDPYGVNIPAEIERSNSLAGPAEGGRASADNWTVSVDGGQLALALSYTTGKRGWSASEAKPFSAANPDFYRIYRYDNIIDLVMSQAVGKPMQGSYALTSSVPELTAIFNGNEETMAILDVPVRVRDIFLP
jgi:hypothetical protein